MSGADIDGLRGWWLKRKTKPKPQDSSLTQIKSTLQGSSSTPVQTRPRTEKHTPIQIETKNPELLSTEIIPAHPKLSGGVFGVALEDVVSYASTKFESVDSKGQKHTYGSIPLIVGRCGEFLKEQASNNTPSFRPLKSYEFTSNINRLIQVFDSPPNYGRNVSWARYSVRDVATVFLYYLEELPEPVIPRSSFKDFLAPLRGYRYSSKGVLPSDFNYDAAIKRYKGLFSCLNSLNRYLLEYILSIIAVFKLDSQIDFRSAGHLARIFQPVLLSLRSCTPGQISLARDVITFLIHEQRVFAISQSAESSSAVPAKPLEVGRETINIVEAIVHDAPKRWDQFTSTTSNFFGSNPSATRGKTQQVLEDETTENAAHAIVSMQPVNDSTDSKDSKVKRKIKSSFIHRHNNQDTGSSSHSNQVDMNTPVPSALPRKPSPIEKIELQKSPNMKETTNKWQASAKDVIQTNELSLVKDQDLTLKPLRMKSTISVLHADDKIEPEISPSRATSQGHGLDLMFQLHQERKDVFSEAEIAEVAQALQMNAPSWSMIPRIYIVLRLIGCLDTCDRIVESGFSDYELPVSSRGIPKQLNIDFHSQFLDAQKLVLTKTVDLERGAHGQHHHFDASDSFPFDIRERLGAGGFGQVDRVISLTTRKEFALKRFTRKSVSMGKGLIGLRAIIAEIAILKTLTHRHIVQFVGSYTDPKFLGLLMTPVAELDFSDYLAQATSAQYHSIRSFFGCLTTGLGYLHAQKIRHKDIKPGNILVYQGSVLLTDFGLARDFGDAAGSTSVGAFSATSPRYAAPEVLMMESRNTKSDIWSLGMVFLEMIITLKSKNNEWLDGFMSSHGFKNKFLRNNRPGFEELVVDLQKIGFQADNITLEWVKSMLQEQHIHRPTAAELLETILYSGEDHAANYRFSGLCCRNDGDSSDESD